MKYQKTMVHTLRAIIILAAVLSLFAAIILVPTFGAEIAEVNPEYAYLRMPCQIFLWISAVVFLIALVLAWRITSNIAAGESFSLKNAALLMYISRLALAECIWYGAGSVALFIVNALHPSILLADVVMVSIGICATVACAALSHLAERAAYLQAENDLTI